MGEDTSCVCVDGASSRVGSLGISTHGTWWRATLASSSAGRSRLPRSGCAVAGLAWLALRIACLLERSVATRTSPSFARPAIAARSRRARGWRARGKCLLPRRGPTYGTTTRNHHIPGPPKGGALTPVCVCVCVPVWRGARVPHQDSAPSSPPCSPRV